MNSVFSCAWGSGTIHVLIDQKTGEVQVMGAKKLTSIYHVSSETGKFIGSNKCDVSAPGLAITIDNRDGQENKLSVVAKNTDLTNRDAIEGFPRLEIDILDPSNSPVAVVTARHAVGRACDQALGVVKNIK